VTDRQKSKNLRASTLQESSGGCSLSAHLIWKLPHCQRIGSALSLDSARQQDGAAAAAAGESLPCA